VSLASFSSDGGRGKDSSFTEDKEVAKTIYGYAQSERTPDEETWAALDAAVVRVAPSMDSQAVGNMLWSYATLGGNRTTQDYLHLSRLHYCIPCMQYCNRLHAVSSVN
jgi:hypothetical protein